MKLTKATIVMISFLSLLTMWMIFGIIQWAVVEKRYVIGYVYDFHCISGPGCPNDFFYTINGNKYYGNSGSNGNRNVGKYLIIEVMKNHPKNCFVDIEIPISPNHLVPQPPEGWSECPINEDGSIKEKYRRKN